MLRDAGCRGLQVSKWSGKENVFAGMWRFFQKNVPRETLDV